MSFSSINDDKPNHPSLLPSPRFLPKLLPGAIPLAILLLWAADAFAVRDFFNPISPKSFSSATTITSQPQIPTTFPKIWISPFTPLNYTSTIVSRWLTPAGQPCHDSPTSAISIPALQSSSSIILLSANDIHEFTLLALDASLRPRCTGGDYFETDLSSHSWKSRPPILDLGNGSYTLRIQLHPRFASQNAIFNLSIVLLFRSFDGLKISPNRLAVRREVSRISIKFFTPVTSVPLPDLQICQSKDFVHSAWSGRWTRLTRNDSCTIDHSGRYRCINPALPCEQPWCSGSIAALESNGWVYSAHCSFHLFEQSSAWRCLRGKWLLFWGDSNHVDTIRNLLNFVLGLTDIEAVPRRFDRYFTNPVNDSETLRITNVFNGHWNDSLNYLGLASLRHAPFRGLLWKYLDEPGGHTPDAIVLNSGLHDGFYWKSVRSFAKGAEEAAGYWEMVMARMRHMQPLGKALPKVFYRTTVATGGYARDMGFNPCKMETFDGILKEKLAERGVLTGGVVDEFDMTFPWHYDNRCSDGVHYGRKPAMSKWRDGQIGHQYFVDLMLVHVLLNVFCNG